MMEAFIHLVIFLAETIIIVTAILLLVAGIIAIAGKNKFKQKPKIKIRKLNQFYKDMADAICDATLSKDELKERAKIIKKGKKAKKNDQEKRLFVLNFDGDMKANHVTSLKEEITAILMVAQTTDEIVLRLESAGGVMHGYGFAASQLQRIKNAGIPLTIIIDKVAASGGYMMACVADTLIAAPFAIIGSIGVLAQLPNFHRILKKNNIEFEQITAGQYKRTLSLFGENTKEGRNKFQEEINEAHELFKKFVGQHRPTVNVNQVATGEYWFAQKAKEFKLVDELMTSDDYLLTASRDHAIYEITLKQKKRLLDRCTSLTKSCIQEAANEIQQGNHSSLYL